MAMYTEAKPAKQISRRVIVKFFDTVVVPYEDGAEAHVVRLKVGPWAELAQRFPGIRLNRLITAVTPERLGALVAQASARDRRYQAPNFLTYFTVPCPPDVDPGEVAAALRAWEHVQTAYVDALDTSPAVMPNPKSPAQTYLKPPAVAPPPAPRGAIDAEFAWSLPGGTGTGQRFVDLERGATLDHEDLVTRNIPQLHGVIDPNWRHHGTRVLGVVAAVDNLLGIIGIAYGVRDVAYSSQVLSVEPNVVDRVNAVHRAIDYLTQAGADPLGRVLLLEVQLNPFQGAGGVWWSWMPMETLLADFDAIRLATGLGIVVVEPTGNGNNDLDAYQQAGDGKYVLSRDHPSDFKDSLAIMVGGSTADYPYPPSVPFPGMGTGYGSRVDCFAWAENVFSCDSNAAGSTTRYTAFFDGTSSAAAIVAGAALLVQGVAEATLGQRLGPDAMRAVLSDKAFNTHSANEGDLIGVMPNLRRILQDALGIAPDVYMRDYVGDTGDVHAGAISTSPDVIVRPQPDGNPALTFGPGTESNMLLGPTATPGQDNFVYVRVWNRGEVVATNVTATVYFAPPATLLTNWTLVGSVVIPIVPPGNVMTVSPHIRWPQASVPGPGHYCFVALVDVPGDPGPDPATFASFDAYCAYIRQNNNVTWRNFNVVAAPTPSEPSDPAPQAGFDAFAFEFAAPGAGDSDRRFQLAVSAQLPATARVWLELPLMLREAAGPLAEVDVPRQRVRLAVVVHGRTALSPAVFPAKSRARCRLIVHAPRLRARPYEVHVSQLYEGFEVGRITWQIAGSK